MGVFACQELQQKRAQRAEEVQRIAEQEVDALQQAGKVGRKKLTQSLPTSPTAAKAKNTGIWNSAGSPFSGFDYELNKTEFL